MSSKKFIIIFGTWDMLWVLTPLFIKLFLEFFFHVGE